MYTTVQFGKELQEKVEKGEEVIKIGEWVYLTYVEHIREIDSDFREMLLTLATMELGPEFAFSYEKLNKIANDLIAGRKVNLN